MGVLYHVWKLTPQITKWVRDQGVAIEDGLPSRDPTLGELREVLEGLTGYSVRCEVASRSGAWSAWVEERGGSGAWTLVHVPDPREDDEPCEVYFEKGWPELIIRIVERIAQRCGTLILYSDGGAMPLVISAGIDVKAAMELWNGPVRRP